MTSERNYRQESKSARHAARETLKALREARLRARAQTGQAPQAPQPAASTGSQIGPGDFFSMASADAPPTPGASREDTPSVVADTPNPHATDDEVRATSGADTTPIEGAPEESLEPGLEVPSDPEGSGQFATASAPTSATEPIIQSPQTTDAPSPPPMDHPTSDGIARVDPNSDLFSLPGAGAGMVWMFHQCGIRTLEDLAQANAGDLATRLGVVGHIINMEPWIAFAREVEQRTS